MRFFYSLCYNLRTISKQSRRTGHETHSYKWDHQSGAVVRGTDYASNELYETEELFRSGHPIDKNRLILIHRLEDTVYEPVCTKPGQYLGKPVYHNGQIVLLLVDFPKEKIYILIFHEAEGTTELLEA